MKIQVNILTGENTFCGQKQFYKIKISLLSKKIQLPPTILATACQTLQTKPTNTNANRKQKATLGLPCWLLLCIASLRQQHLNKKGLKVGFGYVAAHHAVTIKVVSYFAN